MAFVLCPECGAPNSDLSMSCPRCGFPIGYVTERAELTKLDYNPFAEHGVPSNETAEEENREPVELIVQNSNLPEEMRRLLCHSDSPRVRAAIARSETLSKELLEYMAGDPCIAVREEVASNPSTGAETLARLADDRGDNNNYLFARNADAVRIAVATNPSTDVVTLDKLSRDPDPHIRKLIALRSDASKESLLYLARDKTPPIYTRYERTKWSCIVDNSLHGSRVTRSVGDDVTIRELVAGNPSADSEVLAILVEDEDEGVRESVASNPSANESILSLLVRDQSRSVRLQVAGNPSAGEANLCRIAGELEAHRPRPSDYYYSPFCDYDCDIAEAVALNPSATFNVFQRFRGILDDSIAHRISMNPSLDQETLRRFSDDADARFRAIAGEHVLTPEDALIRLSRDPDERVRQAVASNSRAPYGAAANAAKDQSTRVRTALAKSDSPFLELLLGDNDPLVILGLAENRASNPVVLSTIAGEGSAGHRCAVAGNASCPANILRQLSSDGEEAVRVAVAGNRSTPVDVIDGLSRDQSLEVRIAVAERSDSSIPLIYERLASRGEREVLDALLDNPYVPEETRTRILDEYGPSESYDYDDDPNFDPGVWEESPLDGWHFDEDNGWLDYYPED